MSLSGDGGLKWYTAATARSGRSAGAYRSLQMAMIGRLIGFAAPALRPRPAGFFAGGPLSSSPSPAANVGSCLSYSLCVVYCMLYVVCCLFFVLISGKFGPA